MKSLLFGAVLTVVLGLLSGCCCHQPTGFDACYPACEEPCQAPCDNCATATPYAYPG